MIEGGVGVVCFHADDVRNLPFALGCGRLGCGNGGGGDLLCSWGGGLVYKELVYTELFAEKYVADYAAEYQNHDDNQHHDGNQTLVGFRLVVFHNSASSFYDIIVPFSAGNVNSWGVGSWTEGSGNTLLPTAI